MGPITDFLYARNRRNNRLAPRAKNQVLAFVDFPSATHGMRIDDESLSVYQRDYKRNSTPNKNARNQQKADDIPQVDAGRREMEHGRESASSTLRPTVKRPSARKMPKSSKSVIKKTLSWFLSTERSIR